MSGRSRLTASGRVALAISLVLAAAIGSLTLLAYAVTSRSLSRELDSTLVREADAYGAAVKGAPPGQALVDATRSYLGARTGAGAGPEPVLIALFGDGRVLSNSTLRIETAAQNTAARDASAARGGFAIVEYDGRTFRVLTTPIFGPGGQQIGIFQTALAISAPQTIARNVAGVVGGAGLVVFGMGVLISIWASRRSLKPLRTMASDAATISHGTADRRIAYDGPPDELGSLADSLNAMLDRLQAGADEQRRFIADASHELRTPLAVIRGSAEIAERPGTSDDDRTEALALIGDESERMRRLLDDLLSLARLDEAPARHPQPVHAPTVTEEAAARARALGGRNVEHTCVTPAWILVDPDQLEQALINLVRNAMRAAPPGGTVRITCDADAARVRLRIIDDGPGIPGDELPRVFDRFFRGGIARATSADGAGLGLAITKRLVEMQDGKISASNVEPHGAAFTIDLPRIPAP